MRWSILHLGLLLTVLVAFSYAWSPKDHEIFRLRDEVVALEGHNVTFYDFIGVTPSATVDEINKAFRKKSRSIHPDKAKHNFIASYSLPKQKNKKKPKVHVSKGPSQREIDTFMKQATSRYSRLGVVASVLKGPQRERYDHFLRHGFPAWRGTGYYYTRYRPGLGTVLVGLFVVGGGFAHYYALQISYKRQREFMNRYIKHARKTAWGNEIGIAGIPGVTSAPESIPIASATAVAPEEQDPYANLNRRQKRELDKQNKKDKSKQSKPNRSHAIATPPPEPVTVSPQGERRRVTAENGKVLLVDSVGNVFLEEEDEEGEVHEFLLDLDEISKPTIYDTAVFRAPLWAWRKIFSPFAKDTKPVPDDTVPRTESESLTGSTDTIVKGRSSKKNEGTPTPPEDTMNMSMSMSTDFEMIDASGLEGFTGDTGMGSGKKKSKKMKK